MTIVTIRSHSRKTRSKIIHINKHIRVIKKKKLKRGPPKLPFKKVKIWKTKFIQDSKTGLMKGRKRVSGQNDRTGILQDAKTGRIFGRLPKAKRKVLK